MSDLLRHPNGTTGKVHDITVASARGPKSPDWGYVGFGLYRLKAGETAAEQTGDREVILVLVEGKAEISGGGESFGEMGERMSVFEKTPPHCAYIPNGADWSAKATTDCTLAVCTAPGQGGRAGAGDREDRPVAHCQRRSRTAWSDAGGTGRTRPRQPGAAPVRLSADGRPARRGGMRERANVLPPPPAARPPRAARTAEARAAARASGAVRLRMATGYGGSWADGKWQSF